MSTNQAEQGVFITLEGVDGSGKSTKGRMLGEELTAKGREVVLLRDPGSTAISERIREILLDPEVENMSSECELLLFEAARAQLTRELIIPALERGAVVVCDRYCDSTFAYQAVGRGLDEELVRTANAIGSCGLTHHRTIVFDLEIDESFERATRHGTDRMELSGESFQARVREGFLRIAAEEPQRVRVVNSHGEKIEVYARMREELKDLIPELSEELA
jgi:dTMP kinase